MEKTLVRQLVRRIRLFDQAGWYDDRRLAVILPETTYESGCRFAENFANGILPLVPDLKWECMTYPHSGHPITRENPAEMGKGRGSRGEDVHPTFLREEVLKELNQPLPNWKRLLDIAGSLFGLILLSPLFLLTALFIKLVSPGPVFFRQERIGFLGKPFIIWKFRTMHVNCDTTGHLKYMSQLIGKGDRKMTKLDFGKDNRLIPLAKVLRRTCIDELPQLFNVLAGDMSLIGPRPCIRPEALQFQQWQRQRFDAVPGMTGLWQVSGKNRLTFTEMMRLDIRYGRQRSPAKDLVILLRTPWAILQQVGDSLRNRLGAKVPARVLHRLVGGSFLVFLLLCGALSAALIAIVQ